MNVLGVEVAADLFQRWRDWFAPRLQPFRATEAVPGRRSRSSAEVRDTFHMYGGSWIWLQETEFAQLPLEERRALVRGREATGRLSRLPEPVRNLVTRHWTDSRIVWWPSILREVGDGPLVDYVEDGVRPSRHREVRSLNGYSRNRSSSGWPRTRHRFAALPEITVRASSSSVQSASGVDGAGNHCRRSVSWPHTQPLVLAARP
ncbi:hypothetical protein NLX83_37975 [Allokutzneria sp. A3M-2-11 16]|uniref:hypothetical protein n=1 Tax=Allokutzneria sp. A3M-2-11 16 TaxID=2962043 RepID=UPI0020B850F7|nr:hypothetical protein [Allokutzneria sp. A3M-2-11 16]MCP3805071.1 hypothetical protein [Allokutzneria sp. A3M-2-11 16]